MRIAAFLSLFLLVLAASAVPAAARQGAKAVTAVDARVAGDEKRTRFVLDLTGTVEHSAFTLADPYRVVLDFPDVAFSLPKAAGQAARGLISAFRYGVFAPGKARIVIDAAEPVAIDRVFTLERHDRQPARLVLDLVPTDRESFLRKVMARQREARTVTASVPIAPYSLPSRADRPVIVIDPGHGGIDTGAIAPSGVEEKSVVLAVAKKLAAKLDETGRFRVVLTRYDDSFVQLQERVQVARMNAADLFISVHADSISRDESSVRGAAIYTVSDRASDAEAARLAEKENKADLLAGIDLSANSDDVTSILLDLAHRETRNFSGLFARTLAGRMRTATHLHPVPLKSAGFIVLRAPDVPSVLLELGFLSNPEDVKLLTSEAWRDRVSAAMTEAVLSFFEGGKGAR
jgi:N-acetylmuramoyl-L-alanine amidase